MAEQAGPAAARALASAIRSERDELVAELAGGTTGLAALVGPSPDPRAARVKVVRLAEVVPGVGKVSSRRVLEDLGVPGATRWGELSKQAALAVVRALDQAGARTPDRPPTGGA